MAWEIIATTEDRKKYLVKNMSTILWQHAPYFTNGDTYASPEEAADDLRLLRQHYSTIVTIGRYNLLFVDNSDLIDGVIWEAEVVPCGQ